MPSDPWPVVDPLLQTVISQQIKHVDANDLELIRHYTDTSLATFATIPGLFPLRRLKRLADQAPNYPYLLHGLLVVSALHLQATAIGLPDERRKFYTEKAGYHQQIALSSYIPLLNAIDAETCHSVFAFSAVLAGLGFGFLSQRRCNDDIDAESFIDSIVSVFTLLQGAVAVANTASKWIDECKMEPLVIPINSTLARAEDALDVEIRDALRKLVVDLSTASVLEANRAAETAPADVSAIFESAIPELRNAYRCLNLKTADKFFGVIGWPAFVRSSYIKLLKDRHPAALVLLAHYGVTLHALDGAWWLKGVGSRIVHAVARLLEDRHTSRDWQQILQWPLSKIAQPYGTPGSSADTGDSPPVNLNSLSLGMSPAFNVAFRSSFPRDLDASQPETAADPAP